MKSLAALIVSGMLILGACKKEDTTNPTVTSTPDVTTTFIKLGETYLIGASAKAVVYAEKQPTTGYTKLYTAIFDSITNNRLDDGHLTINPIMDMGMMQHSAPIENQTGSKPSDKLWKAQVVFSMGGTWKLNLSFHNHANDLEGDGTVTFSVNNPPLPLVKSLTLAADDSTKVLITLVQPMHPKIGLNDIEFTVHQKADMMTFPAVNDYTIEIEPTMPSMGHGSPHNVHPILTENGHYKGVVNFTMSGLWRIQLTLKKNGVVLDNTTYFDISF